MRRGDYVILAIMLLWMLVTMVIITLAMDTQIPISRWEWITWLEETIEGATNRAGISR